MSLIDLKKMILFWQADPLLRWLTVMLALVLAITIFMYHKVYIYEHKYFSVVDSKLDDVKRRYLALNQIADQDKKMLRYTNIVQARVEKLSSSYSNSEFVAVMANLAQKSHVSVFAENYEPSVMRDGYRHQVAKLSFQSSYSQLKVYLDGLHQQPFLTRVNKLAVDHADSDQLAVKLEVVAIFND